MFRLLKKTTISKKKIDLQDLKYWITTTDWLTLTSDSLARAERVV